MDTERPNMEPAPQSTQAPQSAEAPQIADAAPRPAGNRRQSARARAVRNRKWVNLRLFLIFLLSAALLGLLRLTGGTRTFSDQENRSLAQLPSFSLSAAADGSFFSGLDSWFSDQFPGRDGWISLHLTELRLLGSKQSGDVYLGRDGWLLSEPKTPDPAAVTAVAEAVNRFAAAHNELQLYTMFVPGAASILSDRLPAGAPVRDQAADLRELEGRLDSRIRVLDSASPLRAAAEEYIYYKTDHHWTSDGAYRVFLANRAAMGLQEGLSYRRVLLSNSFQGTLSSRSGSHSAADEIAAYLPEDDTVQYYVSYDGSPERVCSVYNSAALEEKDQYTVFFGGNHGTVEIRTTIHNGRSLLVFKDSYANCFIQFLLPCYERIVLVDPRYYYGSMGQILNFGFTDVLFLYSGDTILTDASLADVLDTDLPAEQEAPAQTEPGETAAQTDTGETAAQTASSDG